MHIVPVVLPSYFSPYAPPAPSPSPSSHAHYPLFCPKCPVYACYLVSHPPRIGSALPLYLPRLRTAARRQRDTKEITCGKCRSRGLHDMLYPSLSHWSKYVYNSNGERRQSSTLGTQSVVCVSEESKGAEGQHCLKSFI